MIFKHTATREVKNSNHKAVALTLGRGAAQLLKDVPELSFKPIFPFEWDLYDSNGNRDSGPEVPKLWAVFKEHGLTPDHMYLSYRSRASEDTTESYALDFRYFMGSNLSLEVRGPNRVVVDGIGATLERLADQASQATQNDSITLLDTAWSIQVEQPQPETLLTWIKKKKTELIVTGGIAIFVGVAVAAVTYLMGWN